MTEQFTLIMAEKKKEIDNYISNASDEKARNIFLTLRKELDKINNADDLEERIIAVIEFKNKAKKDSTRAAFDIFEKELTGLKTSIKKTKSVPSGAEIEKESKKLAKMKKPVGAKTVTSQTKEEPKGRPEFGMAVLTEIHKAVKDRKEKRKHVKKSVTHKHKKTPVNHRKHRKKARVHKTPKRIAEADRNVEMIRKVTMKVPRIRLNLEALEGEMEGHEEVVSEVRKNEDNLHGQVEDVMNSLSGLRESMIKRLARNKIDDDDAEKLLEKTASNLNKKVEEMSRNLDRSLEKLNKRIADSSKAGKMEMVGNIEFIRNQIDQLRSELPKYAKKKDLERMKSDDMASEAQPSDAEIGRAAINAVSVVHNANPKDADGTPAAETVKISDISYFIGNEVVLEGSTDLTKTIDEDGIKMYAYSLKDDTGEVMMTSTEELEGKVKVRCLVNEAGNGKVYLRFIEKI